jgi:hypothetical protein
MKDGLHILQHSLGVDQYGQGNMYRDHFVGGPGHSDYEACMSLAADGLMTRHENKHVVDGVIFIVTDAGRDFVRENSPPPPKLTRSQKRYHKYLDADSHLSFGDWLADAMMAERAKRAS